MNYIIITPVRNEEEHIPFLLESVSKQEKTPVQWIIVNDGSTDRTESFIDEYAARFLWITKVNLDDQGFRAGTGPAVAFNKGLAHIAHDYDFIVNLDGDVSFKPDYFARIFNEFEKDSKLGVASGKSYYLVNGKKELYRCAEDSTMGPSKVYRKQCFLDIGGRLDENPWWDRLDDLKAQKAGWRTRSFKDIHFIHHKRIGINQGSLLKVNFNLGRITYQYGYHPLFAFFKSIYRLADKPYIFGGILYLAGFITACVTRPPRLIDPELMAFERKEQMKKILSLFKGKKS